MNNLNRIKSYLTILLVSIIICQIFADIEPQDTSYQTEKLPHLTPEKKLHTSDTAKLPKDDGGGGGGTNNDGSAKIFKTPDVGFLHAFIASLSVIVVSELGDKTFFIAAIMAMRHPRLTVFAGAIGALALMTVLSAVFGMAATVIPRVYTYYISTALFAIFGLKMLKEGYYMSPNEGQEELEEVQMDIRKREDEQKKKDDARERKELEEHRNLNNNTDDLKSSSTSLTTSAISKQNDKLTTSKTNLSNRIIINKNINNSLDDSSSSDNKDDSIINEDAHQRESLLKNSKSIGDLQLHHKNGEIRPTTSFDILYISKSKTRRSSGDTATIQNADSNMDLKQLNKNKRLEKEASSILITQDPESGVVKKQKRNVAWYLASRILMQSFTMTFLAEWGDRSQLTTIILSARENVYGVIVGGVLGHSLCTGLAVLGGRMIAQKISVRTVTLVGGAVFLIFALSALFISPEEDMPAADVGGSN